LLLVGSKRNNKPKGEKKKKKVLSGSVLAHVRWAFAKIQLLMVREGCGSCRVQASKAGQVDGWDE